MIDFTWTDHTAANILYCGVIYLMFIVLFYNRYVTNALNQSNRNDYLLFGVAFVLIITACIDGDWFSYREMVVDYDFSVGAYNHGELIYAFIISFVKKNYLLFRIIVWGGAWLFTYFAFKRFEVNVNIAMFFLIAVFLIKFNYSRATLGMASCCLGASYLLKAKNGFLVINLVLAAFFFWLGYEFHNSMLLLIIVSIIIIPLPVDRPFLIVVFFITLPIIAYFVSNLFSFIDLLENEYLSEKFFHYLDRTTNKSNFFGIILNIINYGVFIIPLVFDTIVINNHRRDIPIVIIHLYRIVISVTILSFSFLFMGLESTVFVYRILFMSFIPLIIITVYLFENKFLSFRRYAIIVQWGVGAIFYKLIHLLFQYS